MCNRRRPPLWLALLLVVLLFATRAAVLIHETDFTAHSPDDNCEFCLHASPLGHGVVDAAFAPQPQAVEPAYQIAPQTLAPRRTPLSPAPRGPPFPLYC
jgi:hypothetical protein